MATGDALLLFRPLDAELPGTNPAQIIIINESSEDDNIFALAFDDGGTNEFCHFSGVMPAHYGGGGITVQIFWASSNTTASKDVIWELAFKDCGAGTNMNTQTFDTTTQTGTFTDSTIARGVNDSSINLSDGDQIDNVQAEEYFRLALNRNSASASDDMVGDAEILAVYITEQ